MTATTTAPRSFWRLIFTDIADLIASQPPQALMSIASVCIVAGEAGHFVPPVANIALAVGAEWAYLRGIASARKGAGGWVSALNWGALALVVLYGLLWGARKFGAIPEHPELWAAWVLTVIHVLPIAFVSFAAAKVHAIAVEAERDEREAQEAETRARSARLQAERDLITLESERRLMEVQALEAATLARRRLREAAQPRTDETRTDPHAAAQSAIRAMSKAELYEAVRVAYAGDPNFSRAELARRAGWSEAMVRKALKEVSGGNR